MTRTLSAVLALCIGVMIMTDAAWILDFAYWSTAYIYVPLPGLWGVPLSRQDAENTAFMAGTMGVLLAISCSFYLGFSFGFRNSGAS